MKTSNVKAMGFGFSTVNAGQRAVVVEPQIVAVSTEGNFRITPPVSRALNISSGDYIMFLTNVDNIDNAIVNRTQEVVDFCVANNLEVGSPEASIAIHKEFDMWAIAKSIKEYDSKGNVRTTTERLTKKDKVTFATQNFDEMLSAALADADQATKDALTRDGVTKEEQINILSAFVVPRELPKFKGAKTANPSGMTGIGASLNFTDSNVWKQVKADMGDDANKMNRIFNLNLDEIQDIAVDNGYETVTVKALILGDYVDKEPARIGNKSDEATEVEE